MYKGRGAVFQLSKNNSKAKVRIKQYINSLVILYNFENPNNQIKTVENIFITEDDYLIIDTNEIFIGRKRIIRKIIEEIEYYLKTNKIREIKRKRLV